jgi:hypothetical protein
MADIARILAGAVGVSVLALWLVLSAVNQYRCGVLLRRMKRHDVLLLLPTWTYFWQLGVMDCIVFYRDRLKREELTPWQRHSSYHTRLFLRPFWDPERKLRYGVFDTCMQVINILESLTSGDLLKESPAYRSLVNFVCQQPGSADSIARQFVIVDSISDPRTGKMNILFISPFHDLP